LDTPFIFVSGSIGEEMAVAAMKAGANDYVMKGNLTRLVPTIEREMREAQGRSARKRAEAALLESEERLRAIFESTLDAIVTIDAAGAITGWNVQAEAMFGWARSEVTGRILAEVVIPPAQREAHREGLARFLATGEGPILRRRIEVAALHRDGREFPVELTISPVRLGSTWEFSAFIRDLTVAHETEAALRHAELSYATLVDRAPVGIYRSTPEGRFLTVNRALLRMMGYDLPDEMLRLDIARDVYADPAERLRLLARDLETDREYDEVEATWKHRDGRRLTVQLSVRAVRGANRNVEAYETIVRDLTGQRQLEAQLVLSQRMEAIGRLAGGVAHDFNNLLTVITSYSDLILETLPAGHPQRDDVEQIIKAAAAAATLTRQLLAFSRRQVLQPAVLDLNAVVSGTEKILRRLIGEDIDLVTTLAPDLGAVKADSGQVEQVIMNLAVNARDAMPTGGRLTLETANVEMDESYIRGHPLARPGRYVMLAVSDTGTGMDGETQAHIFEPFFTTKPSGQGTGLGLATVYGIVKQSGGFIWVYSEPGRGASFKAYLPRVDEPVSRAAVTPVSRASLRGSETVFLVEDVAAVRAVARQVLERQGYTVLEAPDGGAALRSAAAHVGPIHLLLTDVVMPTLSGRLLAEQLAPTRPAMRVLYMSGYTDNAIVHHGLLDRGIAYLQKPFTPDALARKVRDVLDAPEGDSIRG
jgi:PAS domain S-box-containing protein